MYAGDLPNRRGAGSDRSEYIHNLWNRSGDSGQEQRCRAAGGVIIANCPKRFTRSLHRVTTNRSVNVKIDEPGREVVATKVDCVGVRSPSDLNDLSVQNYDLAIILNSI